MSPLPDDAKQPLRAGLELLTAWREADAGVAPLLEERLASHQDAAGGLDAETTAGLVQLCGMLLTLYAEQAGLSVEDALGLLGRYVA